MDNTTEKGLFKCSCSNLTCGNLCYLEHKKLHFYLRGFIFRATFIKPKARVLDYAKHSIAAIFPATDGFK